MLRLSSSTSNLDEIVFENRNKTYGAYALRKSYNAHLFKAFLVSLLVFLLIFFLNQVSRLLIPPKVVETVELVTPFKPMTDFVLEIEPAKHPDAPAVRLQPANNPDAAMEVVTQPATQAPQTEPQHANSNNANALPVDPGPVSGSNEGGYGIQQVGTPELNSYGIVPDAHAIYEKVEVMPEFPGGDEALSAYLRNNIEVPQTAINADASGSVSVSFVVESYGTISNVKIIDGPGFGLNEEAGRVVSEMPRWKPGKQQDHAVRVRFVLPIRFAF